MIEEFPTAYVLVDISWILPRAYPSGLGISLEKLYLDELQRPVQGDLRVNNSPNPKLTDKEIFMGMSLGDTWDDADIIPAFNYLYKCRHVRTLHVVDSWAVLSIIINYHNASSVYFFRLSRIPPEWQPVMKEFHQELQNHVAQQHYIQQYLWNGVFDMVAKVTSVENVDWGSHNLPKIADFFANGMEIRIS